MFVCVYEVNVNNNLFYALYYICININYSFLNDSAFTFGISRDESVEWLKTFDWHFKFITQNTFSAAPRLCHS